MTSNAEQALAIVGRECQDTEAGWRLYQSLKRIPRPPLPRLPWVNFVMCLASEELDVLDAAEAHDERGYMYDLPHGGLSVSFSAVRGIITVNTPYDTVKYDCTALTIDGKRYESRLEWLTKLFNQMRNDEN